MKRHLVAATILTVALLAGCSRDEARFLTPQRLETGLVIILPGIEGESPLNHDIRRGLWEGGVGCAMPIYKWGRPIPIAGPLINQMDVIGNRLEARKIAQMVVAYQDTHPGRPVYLIGHSGGGGMAVFAAEALPPGRQVDGLILLSASLSSGYDLTKALAHTKHGLVNFYTKADIGFLVIGTTLAGNVDGVRGPAAGAVGFETPDATAEPAKREAYSKLYQFELTSRMAGGLVGAHASTTHREFVARHVAPLIKSGSWLGAASSQACCPQRRWTDAAKALACAGR